MKPGVSFRPPDLPEAGLVVCFLFKNWPAEGVNLYYRSNH